MDWHDDDGGGGAINHACTYTIYLSYFSRMYANQSVFLRWIGGG